MTKQATLGPIDPSVQGPLNPVIPGAPPTARVPVSVEAINGYIEFTRQVLGKRAHLEEIVKLLSQHVHPIVLGDAFRARSQIRMLAKKLLSRHITDEKRIEKILEFLCSESGSHDYTINRREAQNDLGLNIEKPNDDLYSIIKRVFDDISNELGLTEPFSPNVLIGAQQTATYQIKRAIVESITGGCHSFVSEGSLSRKQFQPKPGLIQEAILDQRTFEGWRYEHP